MAWAGPEPTTSSQSARESRCLGLLPSHALWRKSWEGKTYRFRSTLFAAETSIWADVRSIEVVRFVAEIGMWSEGWSVLMAYKVRYEVVKLYSLAGSFDTLVAFRSRVIHFKRYCLPHLLRLVLNLMHRQPHVARNCIAIIPTGIPERFPVRSRFRKVGETVQLQARNHG